MHISVRTVLLTRSLIKNAHTFGYGYTVTIAHAGPKPPSTPMTQTLKPLPSRLNFITRNSIVILHSLLVDMASSQLKETN